MRRDEDFADEVLLEPDEHGGARLDTGEYELDYRVFKQASEGKKWLAKAIAETGEFAGSDQGYGPGILFSAKDVRAIAKGLSTEWKKPAAPLRELLAFYRAAATAKQVILMTAS
jgi:hypothetical protein